MLSLRTFAALTEAQLLIGQWDQTYHHRYPHNDFSNLPPTNFASQWATEIFIPPVPHNGRSNLRAVHYQQFSHVIFDNLAVHARWWDNC